MFQLTEALTALCTEWLFSRQLSEVVRSRAVLFESPKGYAAASSKSRTPSMCQPGLNLPLWGQRLWSLYSIDGVWIKECKRCSLRYFSGVQLRKSIGRLYGSTYDRYYQSLVLPTHTLYKVDISLNRTHLFLLVESKLNSFSSHFYF